MQPEKKSFAYYVKIGYEYSGKKLIEDISKLNYFDDYVLIIDDILDQSKLRNGKKCLYLDIGKDNAIKKANEFKKIGENFLKNLTIKFKVDKKIQKEIHLKIIQLFKQIDKGQEIDQELKNSKLSYEEKLGRYMEMVELFTGGHIKIGLEIGQLLANKKIDEDLGKIAEYCGVIRQIEDDIDDYFESHHEPFGDFKNNANRLPEIIFLKNKGNRDEILKLLSEEKFGEVRNQVLSKNNLKEIYQIIENLKNKIKLNHTSFNINLIL